MQKRAGLKWLVAGLFLLFMMVVSGLLGYGWGRYHQAERPRFVTTRPLALYGPDGSPGRLPAGVELYDAGGPDEFPHFMLYVGTKELTSLAPLPAEPVGNRNPTEAVRYTEVDKP